MVQIISRIILALALLSGIAPAMAQAPAPVPALPDTERRTSYSISASTCQCAVGFQLYGDSTDVANWLTVFINGVQITQSGNWSITSPTGQIGSIARPITDAVLTFTLPQTGTVQIVGAQRPRRLTEVSENRGVAARDFNQFANTVFAELRELWDRQARTVQGTPGETLNLLPLLAARANTGACFDSGGNLVSCVTVPSGTFIAGSGITFTGSGPTTISTATYAAGIGINFTGSAPTVISSAFPLVASRALAATLNLSAYTAIQTAGYATASDGGGATFVKLSPGSPFRDTYITGATLVGGSGYTNGTYLGVPLGNGTGLGCSGSVVVSGGAVTAINNAVPCPGYAVGDVLTIVNTFIGGTGSGITWTVTSTSAPMASFTDSVGTLFQYVTGQAGFANVLQFGCKGDWNGVDGSATNNSACIWSAAAWASFPVGTSQALVYGNQVVFPRGSYMTCGNGWNGTIYNIPIPKGVRFTGMGVGGTTLIECATDTSSNHYIELCDSNALTGQFGCKIESMSINTNQVTTSTAGIATIYSNSGQQFILGEHLEIQSGARSCVKYEIGKGGASQDIWSDIDCNLLAATNNPGFSFNSSSTQHFLLHSNIGCAGAGGCTTAISHLSGRLVADGLDIEAFVTGLAQNVSVSGNISVYRNVQQNSNNCTQAISLISTNTPGNILFENVATGCPTTITNGQAGGSPFTGNIVKQITCVSGACS